MKWIVGLSVIVAIAMGWAATAVIPAAPVSVDGASFKFLPPETDGVAFIDVAALKQAPLFQDIVKDKGLSLPRDLAEFSAATGFDPTRDIDKVTVGKVSPNEGLVIAQGRIDKFKIEQYLRDKGKVPEVYLGQTLYRDDNGAFLILDNIALVGPASTVKRAIDQMQLPGSLPLRSDLMDAIRTIEAGNQVWGVGSFSANDLRTVGVRGPAPVVEMLKSLSNGTYQMRIDTDLHARAIGNFTDAESAKNLADLARGALAVAKLQVAQRQPDLIQALDGVQVGNSGATLTVTVEESGDLLKKLQTNVKPALEKNLQ